MNDRRKIGNRVDDPKDFPLETKVKSAKEVADLLGEMTIITGDDAKEILESLKNHCSREESNKRQARAVKAWKQITRPRKGKLK